MSDVDRETNKLEPPGRITHKQCDRCNRIRPIESFVDVPADGPICDLCDKEMGMCGASEGCDPAPDEYRPHDPPPDLRHCGLQFGHDGEHLFHFVRGDARSVELLEDEDGAPYPDDVQAAFRARVDEYRRASIFYRIKDANEWIEGTHDPRESNDRVDPGEL